MILTGENRRTQRKTCSNSTLSSKKHTWIDPISNPGFPDEKPDARGRPLYVSSARRLMTVILCSAMLVYRNVDGRLACVRVSGAVVRNAQHRTSVTLMTGTEPRGQGVSTPASYSGSLRFKSRPGDRLSWLSFPLFFPVPPDECRDSTLKLGNNRFLSNSLQFTIHLSPLNSTLYSLSYWKSVVK
jgi:hypothetical protein